MEVVSLYTFDHTLIARKPGKPGCRDGDLLQVVTNTNQIVKSIPGARADYSGAGDYHMVVVSPVINSVNHVHIMPGGGGDRRPSFIDEPELVPGYVAYEPHRRRVSYDNAYRIPGDFVDVELCCLLRRGLPAGHPYVNPISQ